MSHVVMRWIFIACTAIVWISASSYGYSLTFVIDDVGVEELPREILKQLKIPVCLEVQNLDPRINGITAKNKLRSLELKKNKLTKREEKFLSILPSIVKATPDAIVDWDLPRLTKKIEADNIEEMLSKINLLFPKYHFLMDNTYLIIKPKDSSKLSEIRAPDIVGKDLTISAVMELIEPSLNNNGINFGFNIIGQSSALDISKLKTSDLNLVDESLASALTRLCQSVEPRMTWTLKGMKGSQVLSFSTIK